MAETIESFVSRLQQEGVEAGRQASEKIQAEARNQAENIISQAKTDARKVLSDAKDNADKSLARGRTELDLAARDVVLRLRQVLNNVLRSVLGKTSEKALSDGQFIRGVLHDLTLEYAKADISGGATITVNVSPELEKSVCEWALHEIASKVREKGISVNVKTSLKEAGFEYSVSGAVVEVTLDSVVQALMEMVSPHLRKIVSQAISELSAGGGKATAKS